MSIFISFKWRSCTDFSTEKEKLGKKRFSVCFCFLKEKISYILTPKHIRLFQNQGETISNHFQPVRYWQLYLEKKKKRNDDTIATHSIKSNTSKNEQKSNLNLQKHNVRAYKCRKNIKKPLIHEKKNRRCKKYYTIISIVLALL